MTLGGLIDRQRGHLFCWVPVCLACGIGGYFALPVEPGLGLFAGFLAVFLGLSAWLRVADEQTKVLIAAGLLILAGFSVAAWRAHAMAAPMLDFRYYGPVEGRVLSIDRSISDKPRLLMDRVRLSRVDPDKTPQRVRVSLHGDATLNTALDPGKRVMVTAHLSAPRGPVEPGGFDFRRHAWFQQIGAVGYSRTPVMGLAPVEGGAWIALQQFRRDLSAHVIDTLPGQRGAFAAAVLTGDRSALSRPTIDAMRDTNLAHLLAISGLHMGLLTAVVFAFLRGAIALVPPIALRINSKKWAACGALMAAAAYLAMSGGNVSTQRAFVMVSVMLCAILLDKRALSLRAVAVAAVIILLLRPEALLGPGFQMSFAATTCLVFVFGRLRENRELIAERNFLPNPVQRRLRPLGALVVSSAVAGLATAPIGMAHFNTSASYGLFANLMAVPLMGSLVMPAAVFAALLSPFGLEGVGLWIMGQGIALILAIADSLATWPGAVRYVQAPPGGILALVAFGALVAMLWQGRGRFIGLVPMVLAFGLWAVTPRPALLISEDAKLVGVMTPEGRALNRDRGNGFTALSWLENDGDPATREEAFDRWSAATPRLENHEIKLKGNKDKTPLCVEGSVTISQENLDDTGPCLVFDPASLALTGAVALNWTEAGALRVTSVRDTVGQRLWSPPEWQTPRRRAGSAAAQ
ncbi:MAG: ComEC/Rec2 family competence protein [Pseudomonadota bacterium]